MQMTESPLGISNELLALFLTILGSFGIAIWRLAVLHTRLGRLEEDVEKLTETTTALSIRSEAHILVKRALEEMDRDKK
jgi:hypothetical protein